MLHARCEADGIKHRVGNRRRTDRAWCCRPKYNIANVETVAATALVLGLLHISCKVRAGVRVRGRTIGVGLGSGLGTVL